MLQSTNHSLNVADNLPLRRRSSSFSSRRVVKKRSSRFHVEPRSSSSSSSSHFLDAMPTTKTVQDADGNLITRLVSNVNHTYTVEGAMTLVALPSDVYNMLTDYEAAPRVFPSNVKAVEYLGNEDGLKRIKQTCNWKFFVFGGNFNIELGVVENDRKRKMKCSLQGDVEEKRFGFLRKFEGTWEVEKVGKNETRVKHVLSVKPSLTPPYASNIFVKQVEGILLDVKKEVESWEGEGYEMPQHRKNVKQK